MKAYCKGKILEKQHSIQSSKQVRYAMAVDLRKCTWCHSCFIACKMENRVPLGVWRTWGNLIERGEFQETNKTFFPMFCNNCENPYCVTVCPVKATFKRNDGIVEINPHLCVGCKMCILGCPYQMRYLHPHKRIADKCHWCLHRVKAGLQPACVMACPTEALIFGNLRNKHSDIAKLISASTVQVLKPGMGTEPHVFYIGAETNLTEIGRTPYK